MTDRMCPRCKTRVGFIPIHVQAPDLPMWSETVYLCGPCDDDLTVWIRTTPKETTTHA